MDTVEYLNRRWVQESNARGDDDFLGHGNLPPSAAELKRLERENKQPRLEREILKKAAASMPKSWAKA